MTDVLQPPSLKPGDTIGVFAPSSYVEKEDIKKSVKLLEQKGYKVFVHPQTYERLNQSAGNHLQKSLAFQGLWQRDDIKAIWAAGGGNRAMYLLDMINFEKLIDKPKILIGFSDVTALLNAVYAHTKCITFHGPVFKNIHKCHEIDHLLSILSGKGDASYPYNEALVIRHGKAEGRLVGGNLSIFQYLPSTLPNNFWKDSILFLEDCHEELSRIDRMILHLKRAGILANVKALLLGEFTDMPESQRPFGFKFEEIVSEITEDLNIPVVMNLPFGHGKTFYSFPVGGKAEVNTEEFILKLKEPATTT